VSPKQQDFANPEWLETEMPEVDLGLLKEYAGRTSQSTVYPIDISILDAAVDEHIEPLANGVATITREPLTLGSVRYNIVNNELGPLGAIRLRKLGKDQAGNDRTELTIETPPVPARRGMTSEEYAMIQGQVGRAAHLQAQRALDQRRKAEQEAHHTWRRARHARVILKFFNFWEAERQWLAEPTSPDDTRERGPGRDPKPLYDEGFQLYQTRGRSIRAAYDELRRIHPDEADALDFAAFKSAINYRRARKGRKR